MEDLTRRMIEAALARVVRERLRPADVLQALMCAIEDARAESGTGAALNDFRLGFNDVDLAHLRNVQPQLEAALAEQVQQVLSQMGASGGAALRVALFGAADIAPQHIEVRAYVAAVQGAAADGKSAPPRRPFLLLDGRRRIDLTARYVTIGRARENDVIVEDRRVSRRHLELRWLDDVQRFLAVDLGSRGGTTLNGHAIRQCTLEAGDVISLGGCDVIYGEEFKILGTDALR